MSAFPDTPVTLNRLVDRQGRPLPQKIHDELVNVVMRVIAHPDADVDAVMERAQVIGSRAAQGEIDDLPRYASKALFGVARKERKHARNETELLHSSDEMEALAWSSREGSLSAIEAGILVRELLGKLSPLDRHVYMRHADGWDHKEISKDLGISESMSWFRLHRAKTRLAAWARSER
jgi:DNA-directed RNA polymerase specialized sigma24 family protein